MRIDTCFYIAQLTLIENLMMSRAQRGLEKIWSEKFFCYAVMLEILCSFVRNLRSLQSRGGGRSNKRSCEVAIESRGGHKSIKQRISKTRIIMFAFFLTRVHY